MANVLLIYPDPKTIHPRYPNSFLPVAAVLLKKGHKVTIIDTQFEEYEDIHLWDFDIVGISTLTGPQIKNAIFIASYVRKKAPAMPLIWGGVHPSLMPEQTAMNQYADIVVRGEGEETLCELLEKLDKKEDLESVKGISFKRNGNIISTPDRDFINIDELPLLPYHLIKKSREYSNIQRGIAYMQTSRGCPHNCGFCYNKVVHKNVWRKMSAERVIREIKYIKEVFNPDVISLIDDEFFVNKKRVLEICNAILTSGLSIRWGGSCRFDYAVQYDKDFMDLLKKSGINGFSFGAESGSEQILKMIDKNITVDQMKIVINKLREENIPVSVNFMAGFPGETKEDIFKTFSVIDELTGINPNLMVNSISIYTPFPSTPLFDMAIKNGFRSPASLEEWGNYMYNDANNLPWLSGEIKKLLKTISLLTECEFNRFGKFKSIGLFKGNIFKRYAYEILSLSAKLRWKYKFFGFPIEWRMLDAYLRLTNSGER